MSRLRSSAPSQKTFVTTAELATKTAGGDFYIRTKRNVVKGLALKRNLNANAPDFVVVGKGMQRESRAKLFVSACKEDPLFGVPTYIKRDTNAWQFIGTYRAVDFRTDSRTIQRCRAHRPIERIAGILFLERIDEISEPEVYGGGFADATARRAVEEAAVKFVRAHYEDKDYRISDHQSDNIGYDLLATKGEDELKLEVKGTGGNMARFFLTRNEWRCANEDHRWRLVVVTNALTAPGLKVLTTDEVTKTYKLDPLAWECMPG